MFKKLSVEKLFKGMVVTPISDLKTGKDNDGELLFSKIKEYKVLAVSDKPEPFCFVLKNENGSFNLIHMSKVKEA